MKTPAQMVAEMMAASTMDIPIYGYFTVIDTQNTDGSISRRPVGVPVGTDLPVMITPDNTSGGMAWVTEDDVFLAYQGASFNTITQRVTVSVWSDGAKTVTECGTWIDFFTFQIQTGCKNNKGIKSKIISFQNGRDTAKPYGWEAQSLYPYTLQEVVLEVTMQYPKHCRIPSPITLNLQCY